MRSRSGFSLELLLYALAGLGFWFGLARNVTQVEGFQAGIRAEGALRVLTWNLGTGVDAGTEGLRNDDLEHVVQVIRSLDPDLVFLQELTGRHQLRALGDALGEGWSWELERLADGRPLGSMAQRGELLSVDAPFLERAQPVVYKRFDGLEVSCVSLHADAFSADSRNRSIGLASDYLHRQDATRRTLLVGDLNLDLGIDKRRDLFTDDEYQDVESYNFVAQNMLDVGLGQGPTAKPDRRLDYIFAGMEDFEVLKAGPFMGQRALGMDHHPLVADLKPLDLN